MSTLRLSTRLEKLEARLRPTAGQGITLEELGRALWNHNREDFKKLVEGTSYRILIRWFEAEEVMREAERGRFSAGPR